MLYKIIEILQTIKMIELYVKSNCFLFYIIYVHSELTKSGCMLLYCIEL